MADIVSANARAVAPGTRFRDWEVKRPTAPGAGSVTASATLRSELAKQIPVRCSALLVSETLSFRFAARSLKALSRQITALPLPIDADPIRPITYAACSVPNGSGVAGYKGYTIKNPGDRKTGWIHSPLGAPIARFANRRSDVRMPRTGLPGVARIYPSLDQALIDIADKHRASLGEGEGEPILNPAEARTIIVESVENLQINQNSFGIHISPTQVEDINAEFDMASPDKLKQILKEWIPQAFLGAGVAKLLAMLGLPG